MNGLECFDDNSDFVHEETPCFFGCYILVSLNPTARGRTYIGFTVNPNRRIRQHNGGRIKGGAKSTAGRGPWDMVLIVHGFPNDISALRVRVALYDFLFFLQFEWAWQNPNMSRRLAHLVSPRRPKESPFDYRLRVLNVMLSSGPWNRLGLIVRWINQRYFREFDGVCVPPLHMPVVFGPLHPGESKMSRDPLPQLKACGICGVEFSPAAPPEEAVPLTCPALCPSGQWHMTCLARHLTARSTNNDQEPDYLIPLCGNCPACGSADLFWPNLIAQWKKRI
ncbi:structure-specific endonuclease subunit SLX1 [Clonorchis sinensis]|uniref:Structure-specific endonuclease subunit SLX1 homolog n=1 Tax=Clonorchis sinensis TaxID=79923 RepID=H2KP44_CLOSI|nr:structure-specific endonuclease subunit SLX1 [Clonorchis sinensis]